MYSETYMLLHQLASKRIHENENFNCLPINLQCLSEDIGTDIVPHSLKFLQSC